MRQYNNDHNVRIRGMDSEVELKEVGGSKSKGVLRSMAVM